MAYYPPDVIQKVKEIDLYTYLKNYEPDELVPFSRGTYMTRTHDSLKISNGMWYWFSQGFGGKTALEYLIRVRDYSFIEAVEIILGKSKISPPIQYKQKEKVQNVRLLLPKKASDNEQVIRYLVGRGIDKDIIQECIDNDLIYQQYQNNNVVFVGYDKFKTPRYAGVRATNSSRYMQDAYGSHKAFSFKLDSLDKNDSVHLFESAIDLLSYATILNANGGDYKHENLLSVSGIYAPKGSYENTKVPVSLTDFLSKNPQVKKVFLCYDNDDKGRRGAAALGHVLGGRYEVKFTPPPDGSKDYNDYLMNLINDKKREVKANEDNRKNDAR